MKPKEDPKAKDDPNKIPTFSGPIHNFYEASFEVYAQSPLKWIITWFELLLHNYMWEFVWLSVQDWVKFIESFTQPHRERGELWEVTKDPLVILSIEVKESNKKDKKTKKDKTKKKDDKKDKEEETEPLSIVFKPTLD